MSRNMRESPHLKMLANVTDWHRAAMHYCDLALQDKLVMRKAAAEKHIRLAFDCERKAADLVADETIEPTRSVLHRSAATLALECGEIDEARRLCERGLKGKVPGEIMVELSQLLTKIEKEYPSPGREGGGNEKYV